MDSDRKYLKKKKVLKLAVLQHRGGGKLLCWPTISGCAGAESSLAPVPVEYK